jgi:PDZ domain-containing secreted protein
VEHFAFILFVICSIVLVQVSYLTPAPGTVKTLGLTYERSAKTREPSLGLIMTTVKVVEDRLYSILLILAVILVWIFFA